MTAKLQVVTPNNSDIPLQTASLDIWDSKYRLKTKDGKTLDADIDETYKRVAKALSEVETGKALQDKHYKDFLWALRHGAIPAGRIVSNAGALEHKPATSTINCTVSGIIEDSMDDILGKVHEAGLTLKAGCGIGYEFSTNAATGFKMLMCRAPVLIPPGRCRSWIFTTKCVLRCLRQAGGVARKWLPLMWLIRMWWILFVPNAKTGGCASSTCLC
jgi:hypothetical protein